MAPEPAALQPSEIAALLVATAAEIQQELLALPEALASWRPADGEWCVKETLGHIIESERRGFAGRIREILAADNPRLRGWDQVQVARERRDHDRPLKAVLDEFLAQRTASAEFVAALTAADLERGGEHEHVGYLRVRDLLHEWVHHDRNHLRQILAVVQDAVWPHMGNAQRFAGE